MKLTWVPWDNNETLQTGTQGGAATLDFSNINSASWRLMSKVYADEVYDAQYNMSCRGLLTGISILLQC
jgi:spore coat protein H